MPLTIWNCVLSYQEKNNFSENGHVLPRNLFHNRTPRMDGWMFELFIDAQPQ